MKYRHFLLMVINFIFSIMGGGSVELTFELPDNENQCFYENIPVNVTSILRFQVITGGQYDVDVSLEDPNKEIIYKQNQAQFDAHTFTTKISGVYSVCFSNEFSTFTHKTVYMELEVGVQKPLHSGIGEHLSLMTQMESSTQEIYKHLSTVHDLQTYHRLKEAKGRKRAEELNSQVLWWSVLEIIAILLSAIGQVFVVIRDFSADKPTIQVQKI